MYTYRVADGSVDAALLETLRTARAASSQMSAQGQQLLSYAPLLHDGQVKRRCPPLVLARPVNMPVLPGHEPSFIGYFILDFILLLGLGAFMLRRIVVSPLERLLKATERVIAGDYSHPGASARQYAK